MTKTDVKEMLVSYKQLSAKVEIWKECLILSDNLEGKPKQLREILVL